MSLLSLLLLIGGVVISLFAVGWLVLSAFRESFWWGVGTILVPGVVLVFLVYKWPAGKGPLLSALVGSLLLLGCYPDVKRTVRGSGPSVVAMIQSLGDSILEGRPTPRLVERRRQTLKRREVELRQRRVKLNPRDTKALARLTVEIQDYNADLAKLRKMTAQLQQERILAADEESAPTPAPTVTNKTASTVDGSERGPIGGKDHEERIPEAPVAGTLHGQPFQLKSADIEGNVLRLRHGTGFIGDQEILIHLPHSIETHLEGAVLSIGGDADTVPPEIDIRRKVEGSDFPETVVYRTGYNMLIELGHIRGDKINGRLFLHLPDPADSRVAGEFEAELIK